MNLEEKAKSNPINNDEQNLFNNIKNEWEFITIGNATPITDQQDFLNKIKTKLGFIDLGKASPITAKKTIFGINNNFTNNRLIISTSAISQQSYLNAKNTIQVLNNAKIKNPEIIRGILLYTDEDSSLKEYIKQHFQDFHKLSGNWCEIFILEKPDIKWTNNNLSLIERLKLKFIKKIDKSEAYDIASILKIDFTKIPCLIFFGKNISQRLILPIQQVTLADYTKYFRHLFTILNTILVNASNSTTDNLSATSAFEIFSHHFDDIISYLDKHAQETDIQKHYLYQQQIIVAQNYVMEDNSITMSETFNNNNTGANIANFANQLKDSAQQQANQYIGYSQPTETKTGAKTILILAANPRGTIPLRLDKEVKEIDAGLQRAKKRELFDLKQRWAVRVQDVYQALLDYKPQIVHFSGHGEGESGLVLEGETGKQQLVTTEALTELFKLFSSIECIVLNACYSEVQARAIAKHVPYVVGMNKKIGDEAAIKFATGFYNAVGAGESVEFAYKLGCNVIQLEGIPEHMAPVLLKK